MQNWFAPSSAPRFLGGPVLALALGAAVSAPSSRAAAQSAPHDGLIARTFELRARNGLERQLDDGYRRHLGWHAGAGDRWAWYLWEVTNGERAGLYVDGTFDHAWADFDAAVDPPGDGADNDVNVEPFAVRYANQTWRRRPDLDGAADGQVRDPESAPLVLRTEYRVRPGAEPGFTGALRRFRASAGSHRFAVYELVTGGEPPIYVVWVPVKTWADAGDFTDRTAESSRALAGTAERVRAELWRFRPDMSICRDAAVRCHRTRTRSAQETKPVR
jgi:hypothetical protein